MAAKFFALLTNQGAAKLSNMAALGEKLEITSLAVGDGGGKSPTPNQAQTALVNEVRRAQLNSLSVDDKNDSQIIAEQIIPESVGGWWIREIGLFDADGILIAVANCPETYKATTEEGSGRTQVIRMMLTVSSTDAVTLKVDPSVVLATRQYVDSAVIEVKTYTDNAMKKHVAAANPHSQYLLIENALKELAEAGLVDDVIKNLGLGGISSGRLIKTTTFAATQTFHAQAATKYVRVRLVAGGGASGAASATGPLQNCITCPGGLGVYAEALFFANFDGVLITVGTGGRPRLGTGFNGGDSSFGSLLICPGGIGSLVGNAIAPPGYTRPQGVTLAPTIDSAGLLLCSEYGQTVSPAVIVALGVATNYHPIYRTKLGNAGVGGSGQLRTVNASQVQGTAGFDGICIVEEYS